MIALFAAVAAMNTTLAGASTVGTLIASDAVGAGWSGIASASGILGTAIGALTLGHFMTRYGRRTGLVLAFLMAVLGSSVAAAGVVGGAFAFLLLGMVLIGLGNGGAQLARYTAAELYPPQQRGTALAVIVWAGTIGAIAGPSLIAPAATVAETLDLQDVAGTFLLSVVMTMVAAAAAFVIPRRPLLGVSVRSGTAPADQVVRANRTGGGIGPLLHIGTVRLALAAMVCGQVSMVSVMTMTPVHLHQHGHGLATVGGVIVAHMIGMFALAPLSGRLADRLGGAAAVTAGVGTLLVATVIAAIAPPAGAGVPLMLSLFLLGYGWNLCFVGGSTLLSRDLPTEDRTRLQGTIDALVWGTSALAGLVSGGVLAWGDYPFLALVAGVIALVPVVFLVTRRSATDGP